MHKSTEFNKKGEHMDNWTSTGTEFTGFDNNSSHTFSPENISGIIPIEEKEILDEKIIKDLKDEYIGVADVLLKIDDGTKPDFVHKQYFKAFLKEDSIIQVLNGSKSFENAYKKFYFEQCKGSVEKKSILKFADVFKSDKLPVEDSFFFNNLNAILNYVGGKPVENIEEKIDSILMHRLSYKKELPAEERISWAVIDSIKSIVATKSYDSLFAEFIDYSKERVGTVYMIPSIDNFVDGVKRIYNDFKMEIPEPHKRLLFNVGYTHFEKILSNKDLPDYAEAIASFNSLHENIFGTKKDMVKLDFSNGGFAYELLSNPYKIN
jgi:hypothetical protein